MGQERRYRLRQVSNARSDQFNLPRSEWAEPRTGRANLHLRSCASTQSRLFNHLNILERWKQFGIETDSTTINGTPLAGVGDKAVRTREDGVQAVKRDRICAIWVKPPFGNKLKGDAMAKKLGEVCNELFALP